MVLLFEDKKLIAFRVVRDEITSGINKTSVQLPVFPKINKKLTKPLFIINN